MEQFVLKLISSIFFCVSLVSTDDINSTESLSRAVWDFPKRDPDQHGMTTFWVFLAISMISALSMTCCFCVFVGCAFFSQRGRAGPGGYGGYGHPGYGYGGYGQPYTRHGYPLMPYRHHMLNQPGLYPYADPYTTPGSYQYQMQMANRYDRQQAKLEQTGLTVPEQKPIQESALKQSPLKQQTVEKASPQMTSNETKVAQQTQQTWRSSPSETVTTRKS